MPRILYMSYAPAVYPMLKEMLPEGFELITLPENSNALRERLLPEADAILIADTALPAAWIEKAAKLKIIQHQGVGYEKVDVEAAGRRGIPVCLTPEGTTIGVAEHVILLILAIYKHLIEVDRRMRRGEFLQWELRPRSFELAGKTLGLVGMGRIGRAVTQRALAFEANVVFADPLVPDVPEGFPRDRVRRVELEELLRESDIVSLHVPSNPQTVGFMNREKFQMMKPGSVFLNTCRGNVVVEADLVEALRKGPLMAAGLDVFCHEPIEPDNPLLKLENVVLTPHIAAGSADAFRGKMRSAFGNIERAFRGEPLRHVVGVDID